MNITTMNTTAGMHAISANGSKWMCERVSRFTRSRGIFYGDNPLSFTLPVLFLQCTLVELLITLLELLLTPIGESSFFPQMLGGLLMGPSIIGQIESLRKTVFPPRTFYVSETIAFFGSMMFMFLVGVKIDIFTVMRYGKKTWAIGISSFLIPVILSTLVALSLRNMLPPEQSLHDSLVYIAFFLSASSFHVTATHLADLKLMNSELGRLAVSSSMVSGTLSAVWVTSIFSERQSTLKNDNSFNMTMVSFIVLALLIVCVLRPIMFWMIRQTPQGKPIKESYIISIFLMVLGCSFFGEVIGEHFMLGPILLGLAVPDGPPLGSALVEKLDTMVSYIFLPLYFLFSGSKIKLSLIDTPSFAIVQIVAIFSFCGKVVGTMLPSLYCKMPVTDALTLGLMLSAQGITHMLYLQGSLYLHIIDSQSYGNVVIAILWLTGATMPIVKFLYDPTKSYLSLRRRTIEHACMDVELRLMACIHNQEDTPSIINLLEMSNPTEHTPICFYVLHLVQLSGRLSPLLIEHQPGNKKNSSHSNYSQHMINAFRSYETQNTSRVVVKLSTSISPYETMHDEVCMQAAEKRVSMLIVPFHKQWKSSGITESAQPIRALNRQLLRTAPCSVGILVERGSLSVNNPLTCVSYYSVGVIFIEGSDDREALVYAMRMADHPNVRVTLVRLMEPQRKSRNLMSRDPDGDVIHKFKVDCIQIKRHDYREEVVRDSVEMVNVLKSMEGCFDLILVGRCHESESSLFRGMGMAWNEYPELGVVGDILVSSDSTYDGSVLVVQQQKRASSYMYNDVYLEPAFNPRHEPLTIV